MTDKQQTTEDYPFIRLSGSIAGSGYYYINEQVAQARRDGAPQNALHRKQDGTWSTTDDMTDNGARARYGLPPYVVTPDNITDRAADHKGAPEGPPSQRDGRVWVKFRFERIYEALVFADWLHDKVLGVDFADPVHSMVSPVVVGVVVAEASV